VDAADREAVKAMKKVALTDIRRKQALENVRVERDVCLDDNKEEMAMLECGHYLLCRLSHLTTSVLL
jgi:hypothetical protein